MCRPPGPPGRLGRGLHPVLGLCGLSVSELWGGILWSRGRGQTRGHRLTRKSQPCQLGTQSK